MAEMTRDQALAFVHAAVSSGKTRANLEAALGWDCVPQAKDFNSNDANARDRAEQLALYLGECSSILLDTLSKQRQTEIPGTEQPAKGRQRNRKEAVTS